MICSVCDFKKTVTSGHPLSGENLYKYKNGRQCLICRNNTNRKRFLK